ncbi:MAG: hypothetical protein ACLFUS_09430 [Candidatus Sumerlaeia bacterium]
MAKNTPHSRSSGFDRLRQRRKVRPPSPAKNMGLILSIIIVFAIGVGMSKQGDDFVRYLLYSPVAIIVVLFLGIEYLILKGRDRSRIYKIELDHARAKRQQDLEFLRRMEGQLRQMEKMLDEENAESSSSEDFREKVKALRTELSERL